MNIKYIAVPVLVLLASAAQAQSPAHLSIQAGAAVPLRNEADRLNTGIHAGASIKVALIPLRFDGTYDRFGAKLSGGNSLSVLAGTIEFPFSISPPLMPVSVYVFAGGGIYNHTEGLSKTNVGVNAGGGVSINAIAVKPFVEGRGNVVFASGNKLTYGSIALGVRL
jgi:hypothetical protein